MDELNLICRDERRRQEVRDQANTPQGLNGIDYVEVIEGGGMRELCVHFFGEVPGDLVPAKVRIEGGTRIRDIKVLSVQPHHSFDQAHEDCLRVTLDRTGDFSCYKICLNELDKNGHASGKPLKGFDPRYACVTFSFKIDCPSELDPKEENICSVVERAETEINYLARDYASFRQLLLDRLALLVPDWRERHVPDLGIALVEVLAYAGDYLSYYQDAVATEAFLDTARKRISVRRHARVVNYLMHEGCNARAWVYIETESDELSLTANDFYFITGCAKLIDKNKELVSQQELDKMSIPAGSYEVFEPLVKDKAKTFPLYQSHNKIHFYTWRDEECCLPRGATRATLLGKLAKTHSESPAPQTYARQAPAEEKEIDAKKHKTNAPKLYLKAGDVLIFEEIVGAKNGREEDADPSRRWAVRLTRVKRDKDPLTKTHIVEIEWSPEDALPFELCLSAQMTAPDCEVKEISVARGNVILVDHGKTTSEKIGEVPVVEIPGECGCEDSVVEYTYLPGKFRETLKGAPLTFRQKLSFDAPASTCLTQDPRGAVPAITLYGKPAVEDPNEKYDPDQPKWQWHPVYDLLGSERDEQSFVVEIDNDARAHVRFGDGECGRLPDAGTAFTGTYRIGNGRAGNTGAGTIRHMITRIPLDGISMRPRNPLAALNGTDAEPISEVKMYAPGTFRKKPERAVTADDYAQLAMRNAKVQRATGQLRWTGSWHQALVSIDPRGTAELSESLRRESEASLQLYRRIGHDVSVTDARYVPLDIKLNVLVSPHYLRGHVEAALRDVFSNRILGGGRRGFFQPDNLTFGSGIYLSALVAAALSVEGVTSVDVAKLQRLFKKENGEIANGVLPLNVNEVAQLDNDPNFPERGKLILELRGGR